MRRGGEAIGLLQFNDRRPGRFTPALLALLERLAANVALGIAAAQDAQALRESEAQLATLFRRSPALMTLSRLSDGRYLQVNDRFCDVSGFTREEAVGRTPVELGWVSAADRRQILALLATGDTMHGVELTLRAKDGGARHCLYFGEILHAAGEDLLLSLASDLTEQKRVMAELEEQRLRAAQADRLHALGEMATGIAHELNQPLNGIRAFAEGALLGPQMGWALSPEETAQTFADIVTQVDRISGIIDHVRAFARDETQQDPVGFRITEPVEGALKVMGVQLRVRGIRVRREDAGVPAMCLGWPHAIEQVLLNLISNAGDALESRRQQQGGEPGAAPGWSAELVIRTAGSVDGETARLEVEDNGGGVATQVVDRIFEPYFTTKEMGKGTGIGLAIVRGIVARHHGRIEVDNRPGDGVTFRIDLPTVASVASTPDEPDGHGLDRDAVGVTP
jgi:PAS domain S-box-containing protein